MLVPIVGVDFATDDRQAVLLDVPDGRGLVVCFGLFVVVVGRAEVERLHAELAFKEALGQVHLEIELAR